MDAEQVHRIDMILDRLFALDSGDLEVIEAILNGGKIWEIPQTRYEGARKPRRWEVSERE